MIQAARSGKQNIIEGTEAGMTSAETELKLLNVARASLLELLADYEDYLRVRQLSIWGNTHPRYANLHHFCCTHTELADYTTLLHRMEDEEIANMAITLIHQADSGLIKFIHWQASVKTCRRPAANREAIKLPLLVESYRVLSSLWIL